MSLTKAAPRGRIETTHGIYRIVAATRGMTAKAVAYAGMRLILQTDGDDEEAATGEALRQLDARTEALRIARVEGVPTAEEYLDALSALAPANARGELMRMLGVHMRLPDAEVTAARLARISSLDEGEVWRTYGRLGRRISAALTLGRERRRSGDRYVVDAFAAVTEQDDDLVIRLHPSFVEAVRSFRS
ncbi:MAG: hypothetical protein ACK4Y4_00805 [Brevundimonas sp.]